MKVLIDTCVIIDALQARVPFNKEAEMMFMLAADCTFEGFITAKSVTDIYYLTHRYLHNDKSTREILSKILTLFSVADTLGIDCTKALSSDISDYEDAVMVETAIRSGFDCIVTRNEKDYKNAQIKIYGTKEFIKTAI